MKTHFMSEAGVKPGNSKQKCLSFVMVNNTLSFQEWVYGL